MGFVDQTREGEEQQQESGKRGLVPSTETDSDQSPFLNSSQRPDEEGAPFLTRLSASSIGPFSSKSRCLALSFFPSSFLSPQLRRR